MKITQIEYNKKRVLISWLSQNIWAFNPELALNHFHNIRIRLGTEIMIWWGTDSKLLDLASFYGNTRRNSFITATRFILFLCSFVIYVVVCYVCYVLLSYVLYVSKCIDWLSSVKHTVFVFEDFNVFHGVASRWRSGSASARWHTVPTVRVCLVKKIKLPLRTSCYVGEAQRRIELARLSL